MGLFEPHAIVPGLSPEVGYLTLSAILSLVHLSVQSFSFKAQVGNRYTVGARDEGLKPSGFAGRADRAYQNYLETFAVFAAMVFVVETSGMNDGLSSFGAALYFWMRVAYLPAYLAGLVWVRTLIWNAGTVGIVILIWRVLT